MGRSEFDHARSGVDHCGQHRDLQLLRPVSCPVEHVELIALAPDIFSHMPAELPEDADDLFGSSTVSRIGKATSSAMASIRVASAVLMSVAR